ncbi:molybdopterin-dependent oxidoreductase [Dongia sp.]|uniref:molybdopterin-dependent oxidoreductase n=1 Tax=Dongia sp. TaxID=1977262 RepID=UPI0037533DBD
MRLAKGGTAGRKLRRRIAAIAIGGALLLAFPAVAEPLQKPHGGEIILTVSGAIANTNGDGGAFFDLALLKSLPVRVLVTETPWTKGRHEFTGVPLEALVAAVGASGKTITAYALNDYSVDLPVEDGKRHGALVVYLFDGQPMLPSDRGPLWIVYPFSDRKETRSETFYQRAVWNLYAMTVR